MGILELILTIAVAGFIVWIILQIGSMHTIKYYPGCCMVSAFEQGKENVEV